MYEIADRDRILRWKQQKRTLRAKLQTMLRGIPCCAGYCAAMYTVPHARLRPNRSMCSSGRAWHLVVCRMLHQLLSDLFVCAVGRHYDRCAMQCNATQCHTFYLAVASFVLVRFTIAASRASSSARPKTRIVVSLGASKLSSFASSPALAYLRALRCCHRSLATLAPTCAALPCLLSACALAVRPIVCTCACRLCRRGCAWGGNRA